MPSAKKSQQVAEITDMLSRSSVVISADYRGLNVAAVTQLRRQMTEAGLEMRVVKNSLFLRAVDAVGKPELAQLVEGPTALVVGYGDPLAPVKTVVEYQRTARNSFAARRAYFEGEIVQAAQLSQLASLPPKEVMIAEFAGALQSPIANFVSLLQATVQEFSGLVDARASQIETA